MFSVLNSLGQLAVYKMITLFKQHVPAFVIATRKCFTVLLNILYFGHRIAFFQGAGLLLVFVAIIFEVYDNYLEKQKESYEPLTLSDAALNKSISSEREEKSPFVEISLN